MFLHWNKNKKAQTPHSYRTILSVMLCLFLFFACKKKEDSSVESNEYGVYKPTPYTLKYPKHFPVINIPEDNPLTEEGIALGRRLYYDRKLSQNGPKEGASCSSCHFQSSSFTLNTGGTAVLPHVNLGWNRVFLWEGKVEGFLEDIMRFEVEEFFETDVSVLQSDPVYPSMYYKAFGSEKITQEKTAHALAQFFRTLKSTNSKYDRFLKNETSLSAAELRGYNIFFQERGDCFHCHSSPLLTDNQFHNIGLEATFTDDDQGRFHVTGAESDMGKFKTPTLRNIELTAPYMHDGRFATLEEVIEHYNNGVQHSNTLDPIMTKPGKEFGLRLSKHDVDDLIAFLKTLTDSTFTSNPDLSNPF